MSIADDIRIKQNWGLDGYVSEHGLEDKPDPKEMGVFRQSDYFLVAGMSRERFETQLITIPRMVIGAGNPTLFDDDGKTVVFSMRETDD